MVQHRRKVIKSIGRIIILILVAACGVGGMYFASTILFNIRSIEIVGEGIDITVDHRRLANNLLFFPAEKIRSSILFQNPVLADVKFVKKYPHTLVIIPVRREAVAYISSPGRMAVLDGTGMVIGEKDAETLLPQLVFDVTVPAAGFRISDPRVTRSVSFIALTKDRFRIDSITTLDSPSLRAKIEKTDIFFAQNGDLADLANTLQTLITGFRIKGTLPTSIDLRFDKPIIIQ